VLSYNVHGLRDDQRALIRVVRHCRPDVVLVQEAPSRLRWRSKCAALARECGLLYTAGGRPAGGNLVLVAHRISTHHTREARIRQPRPGDPIRGVVAATLGVGGLGDVRFGVVGCHLGLHPGRHPQEVREVLSAVRTIGELPVILAGDLNETPDAPSWTGFTEAGFTDPLGRADEPYTFPAAAPRVRIDALLVSGPAKVTEIGVPDGQPIRSTLARASDHLPVLATVEL
jgi:endonuclease/exonuclease/phosphatase family metal-dependent hydrolase